MTALLYLYNWPQFPNSLPRMPHDDVKWHGACCKGPSLWWMRPQNRVRRSCSSISLPGREGPGWLVFLMSSHWKVLTSDVDVHLTFAQFPAIDPMKKSVLGFGYGPLPLNVRFAMDYNGLIFHWGSSIGLNLEPLAGWLDAHQRIDWYGTPSFGHAGFHLPKGLGCLDCNCEASSLGRLSFGGTWTCARKLKFTEKCQM